VDDLSEDLFADPEAESGDVSEQAVQGVSAMVAEEEVTEDIGADVEAETKDIGEEDSVGELPADTAEELAALVSAQVEAVVTRLVDERLPSMVQDAISQEIERIKGALESEK
jgi:hypothetical protein